MKPMFISDIARALEAPFTAAGTVTEVVTDSRRLVPGCLFVAVKGEKSDGHSFIGAALEGGAAYAVASEPGDYPEGRVLLVPDTRRALLKIAGLYRRSLDIRVVAVTGSVGKTTTKEMTALALGSAWRTARSEANLNNELGLSWTILGLTGEERAAVLEMGMDGPGQISPMSLCAQPDAAIVTNIGVSHMQAFGSREGIRDEKLSVADGIPDGGALILCGDDDMLCETKSDRLEVILYGIKNTGCAVRAENINELSTNTAFHILYDGERYAAEIPCIGRHNVYDALAAFTAAARLGAPPDKAAAALRDYAPEGRRQKIVAHGEYTIVEDCYNASPDSVRAALETLSGMDLRGRRVVVLADMLELGPTEREAHRAIGKLAAAKADLLLCAGRLAEEYACGASQAGMSEAHHFADMDALLAGLLERLRPGDTVWFKASRAMRLEDVVNRLYEEL